MPGRFIAVGQTKVETLLLPVCKTFFAATIKPLLPPRAKP